MALLVWVTLESIGGLPLVAQKAELSFPQTPRRLCTIRFDADRKRPARVGDDARACLATAGESLRATRGARLYLVGTADTVKDSEAGHGRNRMDQDLTGEDLRYADVAAYRAINVKAYLVDWLHSPPALIVPLTSYDQGQSVEVYLASKREGFDRVYGKKVAPIMQRPCTVAPCAHGLEEFLIAQHRKAISQ